jgi:hypothetical protein
MYNRNRCNHSWLASFATNANGGGATNDALAYGYVYIKNIITDTITI